MTGVVIKYSKTVNLENRLWMKWIFILILMLVVVPKVLETEYEEEKTVLLPLPHPLPLRWSGNPNSLSWVSSQGGSSASKRGLAGGSTASTSGTGPDRTSPCSSAPRPSPLTGVGVHVQLDVLFSSLLNLVSDRENMLEVLPEDSALVFLL